MYKVLFEGQSQLFETLEDAQEFVKLLGVAWTIQDKDGNNIFDWMDRVGP